MRLWKEEKRYIKSYQPCLLSYIAGKERTNKQFQERRKIMTGRELIEQRISNGEIGREININVKGSLIDFIFYADKNNDVDVESYPTIADIKNSNDEYILIESKIKW